MQVETHKLRSAVDIPTSVAIKKNTLEFILIGWESFCCSCCNTNCLEGTPNKTSKCTLKVSFCCSSSIRYTCKSPINLLFGITQKGCLDGVERKK